ncbi:invasion associated locus B family protein [Epibacterium ulvae]|uniref:invasion associated locus B family protein n=1 Tax=Epibacterium ulvae TaxID=1156985 RepID=UPI001BFC8B90|nr:invasion associated locus B family protein [Epibacterium ulvae]MBT8153227.1 invasion associated locus B family protein [Epibacterium ulvae]
MASKLVRIIAGLSVACVASMAVAQQATTDNRVGANVDWSVFQGDSPKECWGVSAPKETVNTREGRVVAVRRSEIQLFVFYRPDTSKDGQVTFTGGYPFAPGSTVSLEVGDEQFNLITEGEWAWPTTAGDDAKIISAMKRGASATLTARSARGTQTKDTFSLLGFTAAVDDAAKRCNG